MADINARHDHPAHVAGWVATALVVVGALNWLLVGAFNFDLVATIFGHLSWVSRAIYIIVGVAGLYLIYFATQLNREAHGFPAARNV